MGPFDRFNDRARRVLALAQDEANRFNHNYIGTEHILDHIAAVGYDSNFGARPLGRAIQNEIEDPLAELLLLAALVPGDTVRIDATENKLEITKGEVVEERKWEPVAP